MKRSRILFIVLMVLSTPVFAQSTSSPEFKKFWYSGKAELSRYSLDQARYGEMRQGEAVLIFVTEPFLTDKEVKFESGDSSKSIPVLKLNLTKRFFTGIYPYTLMTSIFSPIDFQHVRTLKVTSTSLEWCGQTYMQLNFRNNQYDGTLHSYFQNEADQDFQIKTALLEDEVWTRIRLAPDELPKG